MPAVLMQGILRALFGPCNPLYCFTINFFLLKTLKNLFLLLLNVMIIARYFYCCKLQNPFNVEDKFWCQFLTTWCIFAAFIIHFCQTLTHKKQSSFYFICAGLDPTENAKLKNRFSEHVELVTIIVHIVLKFKLWQAKRKLNPRTDLRQENRIIGHGLQDLDQKSLTNIMFNLGGAAGVGLFGLAAYKYKELSLIEMNTYPNYIYVHLIYIVGPLTIAASWNIAILLNREDLRSKLFRTLRILPSNVFPPDMFSLRV